MDYLLELAIVNLARHVLVALAKGREQVLGQVFRVGKCGLEIFLKKLHSAANLPALPRRMVREGSKLRFSWHSHMHMHRSYSTRIHLDIYPILPGSQPSVTYTSLLTAPFFVLTAHLLTVIDGSPFFLRRFY